MSIRTPRRSARAGAAAVVVALLASLLAPFAPAGALPVVAVNRVSGPDRYATSVAVSQATFPVAGGTLNAVIASGDNFPDGLSAAALAGRWNAPVLLVPATGQAPASVVNELNRLGVTRVFVVGGTAAVGTAIETSAAAPGRTFQRIAGADRITTAVAVANAVGAANIGNFPGTGERTVILARSDNFADSLVASAGAYAGVHPILLTEPGALSPATSAALTNLNIGRVVIMGGTGAISAAVANAVTAQGVAVTRVSGQDRAATAANFADVLATAFGFTRTHPVLATGANFADALSGSAHAGTFRRPILYSTLPGQTALAANTDAWLRANANVISNLTILGGTAAVSAAVANAAQAAAQAVMVQRAVLQSASVVSQTTTEVLVDYTFDRNLVGAPVAGQFQLIAWDGVTTASGDAAVLQSPTVVRVRFGTPALDLTVAALATTAGVLEAAVTDGQGQVNLRHTVALKPVTVARTAGPDLLNITNPLNLGGATASVDFVFDAPLDPATIAGAVGESFALVRQAVGDDPLLGQVGAGNANAVAGAPNTVRVTFGSALTTTAWNTVRRAFAAPVTVGNALGTNFGTTISVGDGRTNLRPDITGVQLLAGTGGVGTIVRVTFDEPVADAIGNIEAVQSGPGGGSVSAAAARVTNTTNQIQATFAGLDPAEIGFVVVPVGAVSSALAGGQANWWDSAVVTTTFAAGRVLGPTLTGTTRTQVTDTLTGQVTAVRLQLTFDQPVNRASVQAALATIPVTGIPATLTGGTLINVGTDPANVVTIEFTGADQRAQLAAAVRLVVTEGAQDLNANPAVYRTFAL